jgi:hypothetical protein
MNYVTRELARNKGLTRYFDGTKCMYGHIDERHTRTGYCVVCKREAEKRWYDNNKNTNLVRRKKIRNSSSVKAYMSEYGKQYRATSPKYEQWIKDNPDNFTVARHKRKMSKIGRASMLLSNIKVRSKKFHIECNLCKEDIVIPDICPVLGIPILLDQPGMSDNSPSVDRIDNNKGYTKDNVSVISMRANRLKSDASPAELRALLEYVTELRLPSQL